MKSHHTFTLGSLMIFFSVIALTAFGFSQNQNTPAFEIEFDEPELSLSRSRFEQMLYSRFPEIENWERPLGPLKIALQAGHWKNDELPDEHDRLRGSSLGTSGGGTTEWEVNLKIAEKAAEILETRGFDVEILPATVPPGYWADLFIAIHTDGSPDTRVSGYKASGPYRDLTGKAREYVNVFYATYGQVTGLPIEHTITRNMRGYYAFNWFRYNHSIHPMTPGVILELGFLTNRNDQRILIHNQELAAQAIAKSIDTYFGTAPLFEEEFDV